MNLCMWSTARKRNFTFRSMRAMNALLLLLLVVGLAAGSKETDEQEARESAASSDAEKAHCEIEASKAFAANRTAADYEMRLIHFVFFLPKDRGAMRVPCHG